MKIKKILSLFVSAVMALNAVPAFPAVKRDVNDPVLREIINELNSKMPKFINRYGDTVFVEDEPVTRGALIEALYEYDKRVKGAAPEAAPDKTSVTRQEFDSLRNRISFIANAVAEQNQNAAGKADNRSGAAASVDIVNIISDLKPNMPMLLDGSLKSSKVFMELQQKVEAGSGSARQYSSGSSSSLLKDMDSLNEKVDMLSKKVDLTSSQIIRIEKSSSGKQSSSGGSDALFKDVDSLNEKFDMLSKKVDLASNQISRIEKSSSGKQSSSGGSDALFKDVDSLNEKFNMLSKRMDLASNQISRIEKSSKGSSDGGGSGVSYDAVSKEISYINERLALLSKKLDDAELNKTSSSAPRNSSAALSEISEIKRNLEQIQANYVRVSKRLDDLNSRPPASAVAGGSLDTTYFVTQLNDIRRTVEDVPTASDIRQEITKSQIQTRSDIKKIEERLNNMHGNRSYSSGREENSSSGGSGAAIATISLGITMIAALFVAR
ncbi:MAG: hypothetical protein LBR69_00320 [Endomicrobium sp.]|jgi:predicted  nucleic acid-binding Zn-ribbon protein|nr:hypothetical protein [Endomicrobium sp.]